MSLLCTPPFRLTGLTVMAVALFSATVHAESADRPAQSARVETATTALVTPLWRRPVVRTGMARRLSDSLSTPGIGLGRLVVGTGEGFIVAVQVSDGATVWRRKYRAPIVSGATMVTIPSSAGGRQLAILGAQDGVLLAVDVATGDLAWQVPLDFEVTAAPVFAHGRLLVTSESNQVVALDAASGALLWSQSRPPRPGLTMQGHAQPVVHGGRVFATFSDGFAMAMDEETGSVSWARPLSLRAGSFIDADATPVVKDQTVFCASLTDGVYALAADTGETLWHRPLTDVVSLVHTGHIVFASDTSGHVWLLEPTTGTLRGAVHLDAGPAGALVDLGDAVALTAGPLGLVLLSPTTGKPLGSQSLGGLPGGQLAVAHGYIAHLTRSGHMMLWQHNADVQTARP
jgi:outer membrane protein assembly factor BamB